MPVQRPNKISGQLLYAEGTAFDHGCPGDRLSILMDCLFGGLPELCHVIRYVLEENVMG